MIAQTHSAIAAATTRANLAPEGELVRALRWLGLPGTSEHLDYYRRRDIEADFAERYKLKTQECAACDGRGYVDICVDYWRGGEHQTDDDTESCDDCGGLCCVRCASCGDTEALIRDTSDGDTSLCLGCAADAAAEREPGDLVPLVRS